MAYLGNVPAEAYSSIDKQVITGDGGTSYTLDHSVANENEIEVFVNNVRQEPSVAYTVSGTALTMTGNVESSDDFYVVFQGKAIQTTTHPEGQDLKARDGTFSGDVSADGKIGIGTTSPTTDLTISSSDPTITFVDGSGSASISGDGGHITYDSWTANRDHIFTGAGNERFRVLGDGGVTFNGDTAATNALDDYEEGDWTPTLFGATTAGVAVYGSANRGRYVKVGNSITVSFRVQVSSFSTAPSGTLCIGGLPYDNGSDAQEWTGSFMADGVDFAASSYITSCLYLANNAGFLRIYHTRDNNGWTADAINNEAQSIIGTITYRTD